MSWKLLTLRSQEVGVSRSENPVPRCAQCHSSGWIHFPYANNSAWINFQLLLMWQTQGWLKNPCQDVSRCVSWTWPGQKMPDGHEICFLLQLFQLEPMASMYTFFLPAVSWPFPLSFLPTILPGWTLRGCFIWNERPSLSVPRVVFTYVIYIYKYG